MVLPILPDEIINMICDYADTGTYLIYSKKRKQYLFKYDTNNQRFKRLNELYKSCTITRNTDELEYQTQICYEIPLKKIPSVPNIIANMRDITAYMIITVVEDQDVHTHNHTCVVLNTDTSTLLLN